MHTHSQKASLSFTHSLIHSHTHPSVVVGPLSEPVLASLLRPAGQELHCPEASPYVPIHTTVEHYGQYQHTGSGPTAL